MGGLIVEHSLGDLGRSYWSFLPPANTCGRMSCDCGIGGYASAGQACWPGSARGAEAPSEAEGRKGADFLFSSFLGAAWLS